MSDQKPLDLEAERAITKVRRLMMIVSATTFLAVAAVLGVIGYRLFHWRGSPPPPPEMAATLPAGAKVLSSAVGEGRIVLTVEVGGAIELYSFDLATLRPVGHLRLAPAH
jgi:hypothetical protein